MRICIVVCLLIFTFCLGQVSAFDLDSLLVKSVGGEAALERLKGATSSFSGGTVVLNGEPGRFEQYFVYPDKYYLQITFSNFGLAQAYDGHTAWQRDMNGRISKLEGYAKNELLQNIYFESFEYLHSGQTADQMAYLGTTEKSGQTYHEVAFFPLRDDTLYAYYDISTGLRRLMISRVDQLNAYTYIDDYRNIDGLLVPYYSKVEVTEAMFVTEFVLDTVKLNEPVGLSLFSLPVNQTADYHFPGGIEKLTIPFEYKLGHIRIPVTINGKTRLWMILDSGASANIFHLPSVEHLNLPIVGSLPAMGIGGFEEVSLLQTDSVQIGGLTLYGQVAGAMNLGNLKRRSDEPAFGGLVGYDFLSRFPVMIDYGQSSLTVFNPETYQPEPGGTEIPFHLTMQVPTIRAELNGVEGDFVVDLGNSFGVVLHSTFVSGNQLEEKLDDIRDTRGALGGIGGAVAGRSAYAAAFKFGDILLQSIRVLLPDSAMGMVGSEELAGNIGNLVLENFRVVLDYKNSRLILYRDEMTGEH